MNKIERVLKSDYTPSEADIAHSLSRGSGIVETRFTGRSLSYHIFQANLLGMANRKKLMHVFENVTAIIFTVDLLCYDQALPEETDQNRMMKTLVEFDSIVNSRWFARASIILLLCNVDKFKEKLARSPRDKDWPDNSGGSDDADKAAKYFLWRFNQINKAQLKLYPYLVDLNDITSYRLVLAAVDDIMIRNSLARAVLF